MTAVRRTTRTSTYTPPGWWGLLVSAVNPAELAAACTHAVRCLRRQLRHADPELVYKAADTLSRLECARMRHGFGSSFAEDTDDELADELDIGEDDEFDGDGLELEDLGDLEDEEWEDDEWELDEANDPDERLGASPLPQLCGGEVGVASTPGEGDEPSPVVDA